MDYMVKKENIWWPGLIIIVCAITVFIILLILGVILVNIKLIWLSFLVLLSGFLILTLIATVTLRKDDLHYYENFYVTLTFWLILDFILLSSIIMLALNWLFDLKTIDFRIFIILISLISLGIFLLVCFIWWRIEVKKKKEKLEFKRLKKKRRFRKIKRS